MGCAQPATLECDTFGAEWVWTIGRSVVAKSVAVLGTGLMGAGMARSLVRAGFDVTVWNRGAERARPLAEDGVRVAPDVSSAVAGAEVVLTMLFDADSVAEVMTPVLPDLVPDTVWVQTSTVGLDGAQRLAALAGEHGVTYLDAPVLGTRGAAEAGALRVLVGGDRAVGDRIATVLDAISAQVIWSGPNPGDGHRLKLAANAWVLSVTAATAQSIALSRSLGLDPRLFLDVISGGPLDCDYAQLKGKAMIAGDFTPSFRVDGAAKDAGLIAEAIAFAGLDDRLIVAMRGLFEAAAATGHSAEDMAAVVYAVTDTKERQ
jgi:3-hydroxyisobutyrate dehydrogenase